MKNRFFIPSNDAFDQITELYNFVWPTTSAIWNLRWQVKGFVNEVGIEKINDQILLNRFDLGSGIYGVNLRQACLKKTWDEQQEQFAKFLLVNLCAIFEGWLDAMRSILCFTISIEKQLQFPTTTDSNGDIKGIRNAINIITSTHANFTYNAFYPTLQKYSQYSLNQLENLIICYRYFKECRNSITHRGGIASQVAEEAFNQFIAIASPSNLNAKEIPFHYPLVNGGPVKLSLRGVVGFGDIIIKIITTLDAEFTLCSKSDQELIYRFKNWANNLGKSKTSLKKDPVARQNQIIRFLRILKFPEPVKTEEIEAELLRKKVLHENY
jgi:hypothetical protein